MATVESRVVRPAYKYDEFGTRIQPKVLFKPHDFGYGVLTALAITLAEPLRKAFSDHLAECGCANPDHPDYRGGFGHCETAMLLFGLLPDGDRIVIG